MSDGKPVSTFPDIALAPPRPAFAGETQKCGEAIEPMHEFPVGHGDEQAEHHAEMVPKYIEAPSRDVARIEAALENGVWNPIQGPLCKFCSVKQCEYNRN